MLTIPKKVFACNNIEGKSLFAPYKREEPSKEGAIVEEGKCFTIFSA